MYLHNHTIKMSIFTHVLGTLLAFETFLLFSPPEFCHLPPDAGPCFGYIPRYFYNPKSDKCEKFIYGGCRGNQNNFKTFKSCHYTCVGKWGNQGRGRRWRPTSWNEEICEIYLLFITSVLPHPSHPSGDSGISPNPDFLTWQQPLNNC
uniref:BPTI/Kunitz inhibitor domain-containing protein n=1 Tax=Anolis carolinensis TaxID=28377 RepID=A0A803TI63_ANOCA